MRIRTIFAAAAAPLAIGGVLLTTTAASASTGNGNGPGQSISAYYWNANGHALSGPQGDPADFSNPAGLALVAENAHGQNIAMTSAPTPGSGSTVPAAPVPSRRRATSARCGGTTPRWT